MPIVLEILLVLFGEREVSEGKYATDTANMKKEFWHPSFGKIKFLAVHIHDARKAAQVSSFSKQTLSKKLLMLGEIGVCTCMSWSFSSSKY